MHSCGDTSIAGSNNHFMSELTFEEWAKQFGPVIRDARERKGLSQSKLGAALGVSRQAVSMWESGVNVPDIRRLAAIGELLGLKDLAVIGGTKEEFLTNKSEPDVLAQTSLYLTVPSEPGSDSFRLDVQNIRYEDTPEGLVFERVPPEWLSISNSTMMPWRFPNEGVYFSPRPARAGNHVVVRFKSKRPAGKSTSGSGYETWARANSLHSVKLLVAIRNDALVLRQYNPEKEILVKRSEIDRIFRIFEPEDVYGPFVNI
jgi:transcriptional regulator with XRE-family HTH domain